MAASNAPRPRKRVGAEADTAVLKRARDGSAFTRCEACNKSVPVVLIDMHSCSLDSKIRMALEAQVVEKAVEVAEKKSAKSKTKKGGGGKRTQSAFFLFMADFRKEYKAAHPDNKNVANVAKEGGERWRSMTDEEKKPYHDKATELKAELNGEGTGENKVDGNDGEQVDQPDKNRRGRYKDADDAAADCNGDAGEGEDEYNELDDDI